MYFLRYRNPTFRRFLRDACNMRPTNAIRTPEIEGHGLVKGYQIGPIVIHRTVATEAGANGLRVKVAKGDAWHVRHVATGRKLAATFPRLRDAQAAVVRILRTKAGAAAFGSPRLPDGKVRRASKIVRDACRDHFGVGNAAAPEPVTMADQTRPRTPGFGIPPLPRPAPARGSLYG